MVEIHKQTKDRQPLSHETTPLPFMQMTCVILIQFCEAINVNVLFPFLAFMIEDLGYTGHRLGIYAGGLAAAFCGAQFCSSVFWGMISDKYGRKAAIVFGTLGAAAGMLVFGSAHSYVQAILGRMIGGALSGNLGVMKSFLTEITDDTNRGKGFSYLSVAWSTGSLIAPLLGGLLCSPSEKYPQIFSKHGIFAEYPYLFPCMLCAIGNILTSIACFVYMVETRKFSTSGSSSGSSDSEGLEMVEQSQPHVWSKLTNRHNYSRVNTKNEDEEGNREEDDGENDLDFQENDDEDEEEGERDVEANPIHKKEFLFENSFRSGQTSPPDDLSLSQTSYSSLPSLEGEEGEGEDLEIDSEQINKLLQYAQKQTIKTQSNKQTNTQTNRQTNTQTTTQTNALTPETRTSSILWSPIVLLTTGNYGILAMGYILFEETIPLFLKLSKSEGGFSFNSAQIGALLSISGGVMLVFTSYFLPMIASRSKKWMFEVGIIGGVPLILLWPLFATLNADVLLHLKNKFQYILILWPLLILLSVAKNICSCLSFTAVMIQVNHSVPDEYLGAVNGLGQSFAALARAVGPALGGFLWSLSIKNHFVFLNFLATMVILVVCGVVNRYLPDSIDRKPRVISTNNNNEEEDLEEAEEAEAMAIVH